MWGRNRSKKETEEFLIREFLEHLQIAAENVTMQESPDAIVKCRARGCDRIIGLELTCYQVDAQKEGGSPARRLDATTKQIWEAARDRYLPAHPEVIQLFVQVFLDKSNPPPTRQAEKIAEEIVDFLESRAETIDVEGKSFESYAKDFEGHSLLEQFIIGIRTRRFEARAPGPSSWQFGRAASAGIKEDVILNMLAEKTKARASYRCGEAAECWLVICASGGTPSDRAGHQSFLCQGRLRSRAIREAASNSGFERVYFWETVRDWHELLHSQ